MIHVYAQLVFNLQSTVTSDGAVPVVGSPNLYPKSLLADDIPHLDLAKGDSRLTRSEKLE